MNRRETGRLAPNPEPSWPNPRKRILINRYHRKDATIYLDPDGTVSDRQLRHAMLATCDRDRCPCRREPVEVWVRDEYRWILIDRIAWRPEGETDPSQRWRLTLRRGDPFIASRRYVSACDRCGYAEWYIARYPQWTCPWCGVGSVTDWAHDTQLLLWLWPNATERRERRSKLRVINLDNIEALPDPLLGHILDALSTEATLVEVAVRLDLEVAPICDEPALQLPGWACSTYGQPYVYMPARAAEAYVADGEWGSPLATTWARIWASRVGIARDGKVGLVDDSRRDHLVPIEPEEPACSGGAHEWCSPWEVVGGGEDSPGVSAHGGGVVIVEVCRLCGWQRVKDTWAQDPETGTQGLESVEYRPPDEESLAWVASRGGQE
ncbi:MAG: hypothetical protein C4321_04580 [Chloroflexota bacterium]